MLLFEIFAALWFFAFGAVIGSFLNVVVWRTPRGESIVGSSRCPKCGTAIRWYNNVPVFGWMWLGGKCRDCKLPISPRYPIVEFICGAMFLAVALAELTDQGFVDVILDTDRFKIAVYATHMLLLCALLAWALMQVDGQKIPTAQIGWLWLIGVAVAPIQLPVGPIPIVNRANDGPHLIERAMSGLFESLGGWIKGSTIGIVVWIGTWLINGRLTEIYAVVALASAGLFLGVDAVERIGVIAVAIHVAMLLLAWPAKVLRGVPWTMDVFLATLVEICLAKQLDIGRLWQF